MPLTRPILLAAALGLFAAPNAEAQGIPIRGWFGGQRAYPNYQPGYQPGFYRPVIQRGVHPGFPGGYQPGFVPGMQPGFGFQPGFGVPLKDKDLERHVERSIKAAFGRIIDDVDVDADVKDGKIEIEVEVEDVPRAAVYHQIHAFVFGMPELQGLRVELEVDD